MSLRTQPESIDLRRLRECAGLTRKQLAAASGYSTRHIGRWENGEAPFRPAVVNCLPSRPGRYAEPTNPAFSYIDLFAGIGGFRLGFRAAGGHCVFTSEWDRYSQRTYRENFGDDAMHGDITRIDANDIPEHDVLAAGFPCQPFSIAGVSKKNSLGRQHGFDCTTQGTLFFDIERIIAAKQPRAFVLENVKNLVSHDRGRTFEVIRHTLEEKLGYRVSWKVIDAKSFVPQHRERIFIVGIHPDLGARFDWDSVRIPSVSHGPLLSTILHPEDGSEPGEEPYTNTDGSVSERYVLSRHLWRYLRSYAAKHQAKGNGFGFGLTNSDGIARTLSARYYKDGSEILISRGRRNPRRLTPRECARLMGFDSAEVPFRIVVSDTQAYRQFGNAVVVPVVRAIATALAARLAEGFVPEPTSQQLELV